MIRLKVDTTGLQRRLQEIRKESEKKLVRLLDRAGALTVEYLQSFPPEDELPPRPPTKKKRRRDWRRRHPGGWADLRGRLVEGYGYEVTRVSGGVALTILNAAPHAPLVEMRDGYFVITGVTEPGGPVDQAIRRALAEVAPGWEVR